MSGVLSLGRGRRGHMTIHPGRLYVIPAGGPSRRMPESPAKRPADRHEITGLETNGLALQGFCPARHVDGVHCRTTSAGPAAGGRPWHHQAQLHDWVPAGQLTFLRRTADPTTHDDLVEPQPDRANAGIPLK